MSAIHKSLKQGYWLRQLGVLLKRGEPLESALAQAVKVAEEDKPQLQALFTHYNGMGKLAGFDQAELFPARLMQLFERIHPRQEAMTLASYAELHPAIDAPAQTFFARLQALASYFSLLALLLLVLINFVLHWVIGPYSEMIASFGSEMPRPTAWLVGLYAQADMLMLGSIVLAVVILSALLMLRLGLRPHQGFPPLLRLLPFLGGARHAFHDAEAVQLTQVLVRAGVPYEKALFTAIQMVGGSRGLRRLEPLLGQAAQLGGVDEELSHQAGRLVQGFEQQSQRALQRMLIAAYLLVGLLIGFVLVAAYLPIFSLGGVI